MRLILALGCMLCCCLSVSVVQAQLNVKVGYSLGVINPEFTNDIMKNYNTDNPWLDEKLKALNIMNGVTLGFRNRWEYIGIEFSWTSRIAERTAAGVDPTLNGQILRDINWRYSSFSGGLEFIYEDFSFGGTLDASDITLKTEYTGASAVETIVDDFFLSSHFFVSYEVIATSFLSVCFRPYIQIPWERSNVFAFEEHLFPDSVADPADFNENYFNFGLMVIFYNGGHDRY